MVDPSFVEFDDDSVPAEGSAIFDAGPGALRRALDNQLRRHVQPTVNLTIRLDPRGVLRDFKAIDARLHNLDKPLSIPTAQEVVMRQELGEFDA